MIRSSRSVVRFTSIAVALVGLCCAWRVSLAATTAFVDVTVVDVGSPPSTAISPHQTVVVKGGRISARGAAGATVIPHEAVIVGGTGRFLIPGLWDMHVHTLPEWRRPKAIEVWLPLFVMNGVTGVRDMGGNDEALQETRERIAREGLIAPRIVAAGSAIDGSPPQFGVGVRGAAEARRAVRAHKRARVDFIKPYNLLSREEYFALVDEARRVGLPVAGHVPTSLTVREVADAGQRSVEHLSDFPVSCAAGEDELRAERRRFDASAEGKDFMAWMRSRWHEEEQAALDHSRDRCSALFKHLREKGTWIVPTLVNKRSALDVRKRLADEKLAYVEPATRAAWERSVTMSPSTGAEMESRSARLSFMLRLVGEADEATALLLAGTDVGGPFPLMPGFSLHEELQMLVEAGLKPLAALRAATIAPAQFLQEEQHAGGISAGKRADLVLLERNPLDDIRNTQSIVGVMRDGRWYSAEERLRVLETVRLQATSGLGSE